MPSRHTLPFCTVGLISSQEIGNSVRKAAMASRAKFERTGLGYSADDVDRYMADRAAGKNPKRPKLRKWR